MITVRVLVLALMTPYAGPSALYGHTDPKAPLSTYRMHIDKVSWTKG